jgi:hypothetical protein
VPTTRRFLILALMLCGWPASAASASAPSVPLPPTMPTIVAQDCPGTSHAGCADLDHMIAYVTAARPRFAVNHEIGHFADAETMDPGEQNRWMTLVHAPQRAWWASSALPDGTTVISRGAPGEQFADAYATCRLDMMPEGTRRRDGTVTGSWASSTTYTPRTNANQRRNCAFIRRAMSTPLVA